jgi:hypothetical protein
MSCKTIRQRCPERTAAVPCNCRFAESLGYPHPLLHAAGVDAEAPEPGISLEKLARDLEQLEERIERLEGERATLLRTLTGHIASLPGARLTLPGREFSVAEVDGMPVLERRRASA